VAPLERPDEERTAGLHEPALYFESKQRILDLLRTFAEHGYLGLNEVAEALGRSSELVFPSDAVAMRTRIRDLEETLRGERLANDLVTWELEDAGRALEDERELVKESLVRISNLEGQLKDAQRTTLKLIAASRNGLANLKRVRDHLASETYAVNALGPLVHDFQELTQVVQELHNLALVRPSRSSTSSVPEATRAAIPRT